MRITDKTTANNAIYNINEGRIKLDRLERSYFVRQSGESTFR